MNDVDDLAHIVSLFQVIKQRKIIHLTVFKMNKNKRVLMKESK